MDLKKKVFVKVLSHEPNQPTNDEVNHNITNIDWNLKSIWKSDQKTNVQDWILSNFKDGKNVVFHPDFCC